MTETEAIYLFDPLLKNTLLPKASFGLRVLSLPASVLICVTNRQWHIVDFNFDCRCGSLFSGYSFMFKKLIMWIHPSLNSSSPGQNGCRFTDDIFKCIFFNENVRFLFKFR